MDFSENTQAWVFNASPVLGRWLQESIASAHPALQQRSSRPRRCPRSVASVRTALSGSGTASRCVSPASPGEAGSGAVSQPRAQPRGSACCACKRVPRRTSVPQHPLLAHERTACGEKDAVFCVSLIKNGSATSLSDLLQVSLGDRGRAVSSAQLCDAGAALVLVPPRPTSNALGYSETSVLVTIGHSSDFKARELTPPRPKHRSCETQGTNNTNCNETPAF